MRWNSSSHPISDLRDWDTLKRLEINPKYQRGEVWSEAAKIMLMDSILRDIPMPKIFFQAIIRDNNTYRIVIDGQQRIKAILSFLNGDFKLTEPISDEYIDKYFHELPEVTRNEFLSYKIDINEIIDATDEVVREIYSRVNKYTVQLSKQELRRADFPGDYLYLSEEFAINDFFEEAKIFTIANRRRLGDVEYTSELLAILVAGIQDKKNTLDGFYQEFSSWIDSEKDIIKTRFLLILEDINLIFQRDPLSKTRFKQKADFYSLFASINELHLEGFSIAGKNLDNLQEDLKILDYHIAPESNIDKFSEYAIKCVSQGNSFASRSWRKEFLKLFLSGTYIAKVPENHSRVLLHEILAEIYQEGDFCSEVEECVACQKIIKDFSTERVFLTWGLGEKNYHISNAFFIHNSCIEDHSEHFHVFTEEI